MDAFTTTRWTTLDSPLGELLLAEHGRGLAQVSMPAGHPAAPARPAAEWRPDRAPFTAALAQLRAYFAGELRDFELDLDPRGSAFQLQVWAGLRTIPYGQTRSYAQLAELIGRPGCARAVGAATARNPLGIVVPCHRVIGASGALTGYAGGLTNKALLLTLEGGRPGGAGLGGAARSVS